MRNVRPAKHALSVVWLAVFFCGCSSDEGAGQEASGLPAGSYSPDAGASPTTDPASGESSRAGADPMTAELQRPSTDAGRPDQTPPIDQTLDGGADGGRPAQASGCPDWRCSDDDCDELMKMPGSSEPTSDQAGADGYYIATDEAYTFLRKDLILIFQHAVCEVNARFEGTTPLGVMDLSLENGMTPGTERGSPRHGTSTHRGSDLDLAYYQTDGSNNPQIVCGDGSDPARNGQPGQYNDGYFCTTEVNIVDWPRQAFLIAKLALTPMYRVTGIDETMPEALRAALDDLFAEAAITEQEYDRAYNYIGAGASGGWQFHHHHIHVSYCPQGRVGPRCRASDTDLSIAGDAPIPYEWSGLLDL